MSIKFIQHLKSKQLEEARNIYIDMCTNFSKVNIHSMDSENRPQKLKVFSFSPLLCYENV